MATFDVGSSRPATTDAPRSLDYYAGRLDEAIGYHEAVGERLRKLVAEMRGTTEPAATAGTSPRAARKPTPGQDRALDELEASEALQER